MNIYQCSMFTFLAFFLEGLLVSAVDSVLLAVAVACSDLVVVFLLEFGLVDSFVSSTDSVSFSSFFLSVCFRPRFFAKKFQFKFINSS